MSKPPYVTSSQQPESVVYFFQMRIRISLVLLLPLSIASLFLCERDFSPCLIPAPFVYSIIEHNDSIFFSTRSEGVFVFPLDCPDSILRLCKAGFHPIRSLAFTRDNRLLAASYRTGVHEVLDDALVAVARMPKLAWSIRIDRFDRVWLAGREGIFRQSGDTLVRFTDLPQALDVDFYAGRLVAAHRRGVTLFDSASGAAETTFCKGTVFWSIDVFDPVCIAGGVETCAIIENRSATLINIPPRSNIVWSAARDSCGTVYLGTLKGLYRIQPGASRAQCVGFRGKCIKSVLIDSKGRLWIGRYFNADGRKQ